MFLNNPAKEGGMPNQFEGRSHMLPFPFGGTGGAKSPSRAPRWPH